MDLPLSSKETDTSFNKSVSWSGTSYVFAHFHAFVFFHLCVFCLIHYFLKKNMSFLKNVMVFYIRKCSITSITLYVISSQGPPALDWEWQMFLLHKEGRALLTDELTHKGTFFPSLRFLEAAKSNPTAAAVQSRFPYSPPVTSSHPCQQSFSLNSPDLMLILSACSAKWTGLTKRAHKYQNCNPKICKNKNARRVIKNCCFMSSGIIRTAVPLIKTSRE